MTVVQASTRERILDVALELFTEKGFEATSLREISERLGFTKAALYYHFASKDDILMALHLRLHRVGRQGLERLAEGPVDLETWESALTALLGDLLAQRTLFLMHERNQAAMEKLHRREHEAEHQDLQAALRQVLADSTIPLRDRVRMACSFGAVFSLVMMSGDAFADAAGPELEELLRDAVHALLAR